MLGELFASQLHNYIVAKVLKTEDFGTDYSGHKEIGEFLIKNVFKPGMKERWDKFVENATGEPLTAKYFVEEFAK